MKLGFTDFSIRLESNEKAIKVVNDYFEDFEGRESGTWRNVGGSALNYVEK